MAKQPSIETLLRRILGRADADALLAKIDRMVARGATPAAIERVVTAALKAHFVRQVVSAVASEAPATPAKAIQAKVRPVVGPVVARAPLIYKIVQAAPAIQASPARRSSRRR